MSLFFATLIPLVLLFFSHDINIIYMLEKIHSSGLELSHHIQIRISSWLFFISTWVADKYLKLNISVPDTSCSPPHILSSKLFIPAVAADTSCVHMYTNNSSSPAFSATSGWNACGHSVSLQHV